MELTELEIIEMNIAVSKKILNDANNDLSLYWINKIKKKFNLYIGCEVIFRGKIARVTRIDGRSYYIKPWIYGNVQKKDGTLGTREISFFSEWELKKPSNTVSEEPKQKNLQKDGAVENPVDLLVKKICKNCEEWDSTDEKIGNCIVLDENKYADDSCLNYIPDPSRFCGICNSNVTNDDLCAGVFCNKNDRHYASQWDYVWHTIP